MLKQIHSLLPHETYSATGTHSAKNAPTDLRNTSESKPPRRVAGRVIFMGKIVKSSFHFLLC